MSSRKSEIGRTHLYDKTFQTMCQELEPREDEADARHWGTNRVYFLHVPALGIIKIGTSVRVEARIGAVWPNKMPCESLLLGEINGGRSLERIIHDKFAEHRMHGEWFADTILEQVNEMIEADREFYGIAA